MKKILKKWRKPKIEEEKVKVDRNLVAACNKSGGGPLSDTCCGCWPPSS